MGTERRFGAEPTRRLTGLSDVGCMQSIGAPFSCFSVPWAPPEAVKGGRCAASAAHDAWSLGVLLLEVLDGRPPFPALRVGRCAAAAAALRAGDLPGAPRLPPCAGELPGAPRLPPCAGEDGECSEAAACGALWRDVVPAARAAAADARDGIAALRRRLPRPALAPGVCSPTSPAPHGGGHRPCEADNSGNSGNGGGGDRAAGGRRRGRAAGS
eukprot:gene1290-11212_t